MSENKKLIGWREWVHLPKFSSSKIKAKVDTGAKSCAIHAIDIEYFLKHKKNWVRFKLMPIQKNKRKTAFIEAELIEHRKVISSTGHESLRPVVKTTLKLGVVSIETEITLVNRDVMGFRMLIGRDALKGFLVDPHASFIASKKLNRNRSQK